MENPYQNLAINVDIDSNYTGLLTTREASHNSMGIARFSQRHSPSLDNLFSNRDVLAKRLKNRPDRDDLIDRNIIPAYSHTSNSIFDKVNLLERKKTGDFLQKKIRARPHRQQLIQRHILSGDSKVDPSLLEKVGKLERQRISDQLNERLILRPGPIELIQDRILPVESPIQNAIDQGSVDYEQTVSPASSHADSPSVSELETGINTLNCTSPSPPIIDYGEAFKNQLKCVSESNNITPLYINDSHPPLKSQISISQKENERLVKSMTKKTRQSKPKVKKLKFHECLPAPIHQIIQPTEQDEIVDERYKRLLEQQTLYLRLQVMQQNAVMNALQGNTDSMDAVNEEIENMITKEQSKANEQLAMKSIDGKKLDDLRVIDLRAQLKQRGLLVSGSKAKLIERLAAFEEGKATPADFAYSGNNMMHDPTLPKASMSQADLTPATTVMQVTAYATNIGQTYQVIQTVPQSPQNMMQYQVLPANFSPGSQTLSQLRLDQVNTLPVVAVTQPNIMTVQERVSGDNPLRSQTSPSSPNIQFQLTPPPQQPSPTIVLHSGLPLQQASLLHREKTKVQVRKLPVISQGQCYVSDNSILSQSVPPMQFNNNYLINSQHQQHQATNLNYQNSLSNSSLNRSDSLMGSNSEQDFDNQLQFRGRASSEPASHLKRLHRSSDTSIVYSHQNSTSLLQMKMSGSPSPTSSPYYDHRQHSKDSTSSIKSENYEDIMDIIGELSSPSPTYCPKSEHPPPYNSCLYDKQQKESMNKFLNINLQQQQLQQQQQQQQQAKGFNTSVPENMNMLSGSPSQNFLSSPYNSMSNLSYQQQQQQQSNSLNHASSTGSIPQQLQSDISGVSTSPYRTSPGTPSNYMNCNAMSPMSSIADDPMDLDKFPATNLQNNTLNWLDLNMDPASPPSLQYQGMSPKDLQSGSSLSASASNLNNSMGNGYPDYQQNNIYNNPHAIYGAQNRSQTSLLYGSSPKPQDGYISLFDLEGGDY